MVEKGIFIVGAGFSSAAGLPLASELTDALLTPPSRSSSMDDVLIAVMRRFTDDIFNGGVPNDPSNWPDLEDIFTNIDLAANTGHHLGKYPPSILRIVRRVLIVRIIRAIAQRYREGPADPSDRTKALNRFLATVNVTRTAFLSLNWDTVIEAGVVGAGKAGTVDYAIGAHPFRFDRGKLRPQPSTTGSSVRVMKPHGSVNWMYCDACRELLWFPPEQALSVASRILKHTDRQKISEAFSVPPARTLEPLPCPHCGHDALGTRFATFSFRKALDFPMHAATWRAAEEALRRAETWAFIGYSMPAADYEFKHLLKRVQMSRRRSPRVVLVAGGSDSAIDQTIRNYEKFFGKRRIRSDQTFRGGLDGAVLRKFRKLGLLH